MTLVRAVATVRDTAVYTRNTSEWHFGNPRIIGDATVTFVFNFATSAEAQAMSDSIHKVYTAWIYSHDGMAYIECETATVRDTAIVSGLAIFSDRKDYNDGTYTAETAAEMFADSLATGDIGGATGFIVRKGELYYFGGEQLD